MTRPQIMNIDIPADLAKALALRNDARDAFAHLNDSRKQEIVQWIDGARDDQHRMDRVRMVVDVMLPNVEE